MSIVLDQLTKRYQDHPVVNNISLEIADGEFFVLLGPSGSGKSTVLRMIAGLTGIDGGRVLLHGQDVTHLPPRKREVGFVFQHYALFRSMTVAENVEFGLSIRRVSRAERRHRRDELLELVGLAGLGNRMPRQLSGGQQQRVALARALAHRPQVLLLDEPFGALDARIRMELRRTIREIQRELGVTTIFVTHDQEEAFELADRLAVLNFGRLLEYGPPEELYLRPQTEFAATFLGTANLVVGECTPRGVKVGPLEFPMSPEDEGAETPADLRRVQVLFRPEDVTLREVAGEIGDPILGRGVVEQSSFLGSVERLRLRLPALPGTRTIAPAAPFGGDFLLVEASRSQHQSRRFPLKPGDDVWVGVSRVHALVHPGLSLLLPTDGSTHAKAAVALAGQIARMAHARVTVLGVDRWSHGGHGAPGRAGEAAERVEGSIQDAKEKLGSGLAALDARAAAGPAEEAVAEESERREHDLVVLGFPRKTGIELAERMLQAGDHHLLLVPTERAAPSRVLICVAVGEPGKEDVLFAGRLVRHLGAQATVLKVLPEEEDGEEARALVERFLAASVRTLARLGVPAETRIRRGAVAIEILAEMKEGGHDLLVLGAPLGDRRGRRGKVPLAGVLRRVLEEDNQPVLIVRAHGAAA
ncbi:MAG TPA: ATP-binding cassette domain-containing protein [Thermoanaerobaculia bacterium]|nr:ATP-binding cassette domain-containing protein [Thermoanaerobaculia bacterium]